MSLKLKIVVALSVGLLAILILTITLLALKPQSGSKDIFPTPYPTRTVQRPLQTGPSPSFTPFRPGQSPSASSSPSSGLTKQSITLKPDATLPFTQPSREEYQRFIENYVDMPLFMQEALTQIYPYLSTSNDYFSIYFDPEKQRIVVVYKRPDARQIFLDWAREMGIESLLDNTDLFQFSGVTQNTTITSLSGTPAPTSSLFNFLSPRERGNVDAVANLFNALFKPSSSSSTIDYSRLIPSPGSFETYPPAGQQSGGYTYYSQCNGPYDAYPLKSGCTICKAGCGLTTAAMIATSLSGRTYTPVDVTKEYTRMGYYNGCNGSGIDSAKSFLGSIGLKTSDYLFAGRSDSARVAASEIRPYLQSGWTIMVLANYCSGGCGHFFWVTGIDAAGNILAYDPYYGRNSSPPINENKYSPFPLYRYAFAVKRP